MANQWWVVQKSATDATHDFVQQAAQAPANATIGPYKTKAQALAALAEVKQVGTAGSLIGGLAQNVPNPLGGLTGLANALQKASTWERVGEVVLGLILIAVGIAKLTNAVPAASKIAEIVR
jgi:nitrogen-specific signal transduction histidine kinase